MPKLAANPAALLRLLLCMALRVNRDLKTCNGGGERQSFYRSLSHSNPAAIAANFRSQRQDENFDQACVCRPVSRLLLGHCFGAYPAPCGSSLFCFGYAALRVTVSVPDPP